MKLEINNLSKKFGSHAVIDGITLDLPECKTLVLIGPSGGGKSTLIRLLAGLAVPDTGWISFDEQKITYENPALMQYRRSIGMVFQSWNLFPHLTALENIILPLHRVHGFSLKESEEISRALLHRFDLEIHAHKRPFNLSGGQVQRIALIRAIAGKPQMLMLDEPTSALDPLMTAEVLELILEFKKEQKNLILITHHLPFARKIADRVLFIAEGKIIEIGTTEEIFDSPKTPQVQHYMKKVLSI